MFMSSLNVWCLNTKCRHYLSLKVEKNGSDLGDYNIEG